MLSVQHAGLDGTLGPVQLLLTQAKDAFFFGGLRRAVFRHESSVASALAIPNGSRDGQARRVPSGLTTRRAARLVISEQG